MHLSVRALGVCWFQVTFTRESAMTQSFPPNPPSPFSREPADPYGGAQTQSNGMATAALILGIVGLLCLPVGIVGLVLGILALVSINKNPLRRGRGSAIAGI